MDTPIEKSEIRKKKNVQYTKWLIIATLVGGAVFWGIKFLEPEAAIKDITIATVELGDVLQTLTASGTVVPALEYTINSPVVTEIKKMYLSNGAQVEAGTKILELDQEYTALEYERLQDELLLRKNNIEKLKLQFDKELKDMDYQFKIKGLQINETDAQIKSQIRLKNVGGAAAEDIEKAKLQLSIMEIEKNLLENDLIYRKKLNVIEKKNLELEYGIQTKRLSELRRKLTETTVKADESGVITWINEDLGKTVQVGEPLVRIANLQRFRVEAMTSDRNMQYLKVGTPVKVRVNQKDLNGTISHTLPTIENNTIKFHVSLEQPDHEILRPNQRVDVYIITAESMQTRRIKNGPANTSGSTQDMFVVRGGVAQKVKVTKGLTHPDYVEILGGLEVGDQVIISDTKKFDKQTTIKLK